MWTGRSPARRIRDPTGTGAGSTDAWTPNARFLAGDHHIHTQYSPDAQYDVLTQVIKGRQFGLDWMVITDHGGTAHQKFAIDQITPEIEKVRRAYAGTLVCQAWSGTSPAASTPP